MYLKIKYYLYFKILLALILCLSISGHTANIKVLDLYEGEFKMFN